jgi:hypothetical protein
MQLMLTAPQIYKTFLCIPSPFQGTLEAPFRVPLEPKWRPFPGSFLCSFLNPYWAPVKPFSRPLLDLFLLVLLSFLPSLF